MAWAAGQSGNPKGRPKKGRALTELLEKMAGKRRDVPGETKRKANKELFAERIWEGLATGRVTFEEGRALDLDASEYIALAKLVLAQIDGPPPMEDLGGEGAPIGLRVVEIVKQPSEA